MCFLDFFLFLFFFRNARSGLIFAISAVVLDPTFGIHSPKTLDSAQPCHLGRKTPTYLLTYLSSFKAEMKTFLFSQYFRPN